MEAGPIKIFGVPAFVFVLAYIAIFIWICAARPAFGFIIVAAPKVGNATCFAEQSLSGGWPVCFGPNLDCSTDNLFRFIWLGLNGTLRRDRRLRRLYDGVAEPRAVSLNDGIYRVTYLTPELLVALENDPDQR